MSDGIEIRGVAKYFGRFAALRDMHLSVRPGEFIALFGRNGAGKTTLLRIVAGLMQASSGTVEITGAEARSQRAARGAMGYLAHSTGLYQDLSARENLSFYSRLFGLPDDPATLRRALERVGLRGRGEDPVRHYSRGMQQRLALARAFLHDPSVLLLDEPFTGLDPPGVEFLKRFLREAHARGKTCVMALHDAPLGYELADRLVVIDKGVNAFDAERSSLSLDQFVAKLNELAEERPHAG